MPLVDRTGPELTLYRGDCTGNSLAALSSLHVPPVRAALYALPAGPQSNLQECAETWVEGYPGYEVM